jgi:hypothetical protein
MKQSNEILSSETSLFPCSFQIYAQEITKEYRQHDYYGKQLLRFQIQQEIQQYLNLIKKFDEMDETR